MATATLAPATDYKWTLLRNSPVASSRTDDIWFFDELVSEKTQTKGRRTVVWDGKDDQGHPAGNGIFICRMCTAGEKGASQMLALEGGL